MNGGGALGRPRLAREPTCALLRCLHLNGDTVAASPAGLSRMTPTAKALTSFGRPSTAVRQRRQQLVALLAGE